MPRPPARETSATSSGPATPPMPDWRMGYSMPRRSQSEVRSVSMSTPSSEAERASVGSRIRAAEEAALGIEPDALGVAEQVVPLARHFKDRKSTRLNSSHLVISYAVFCLKKKKYTLEPTPVAS